MSVQELLEQIRQLDITSFVELIAKLEGYRQQRAQEIENLANDQIALLTGNNSSKQSKKRRSMPIKYAHPQTGQTWTGQGRQPKWFAEYLQNGGQETDLLVNR